MKEKNKKSIVKGFTLIELLAVIVIMGVLLMIAVPSVSNYINNSRKNAYITTAKELIRGATNLVNSGKLDVFDLGTTYYIPSSCIHTETGGESPYGVFDPAYIIVQYDGNSFTFYWTSRDDQGIGIPNPTLENELDVDKLVTGIDREQISTKTKIGGRKYNAVYNAECTAIAETNRISSSANDYFSDFENTRDDIVQRDNTADNNLRFYGGGPENYVTFNGEAKGWRIIGIFNDKIKLIKAQSIGNMQFHTNSNAGSNNWANSSLQTYLNTTYYNSLTDEAKNMIATNTWYIAGTSSNGFPAGDVYEYERNNATMIWEGKVGLMSMSDYLYAAGSTCTNYMAYSSDGNDIRKCKDTNWLFTGTRTWMITPSTASTPWERLVETEGYVNGYTATSSLAIRPVVFLKDDIEIVSGTGTTDDPYILGY